MSGNAVLRFLPWMRRGVSSALLSAADADGVPTGAPGSMAAAVTVESTEVTRQIRLQGPGSVVGLHTRQVARQDPEPGSRDFAPSSFVAIELTSPDLPWMFTPAAPQGEKLIPWLVLVVVEDRPGVELVDDGRRPLSTLRLDDAARELPDLREAWAWAHVQSSADLSAGVEAAFAAQPEAFLSRLMSPRRLAADTGYRACLVPSFEQGRRAGLGLSVDADDVALAWGPSTTAIELPVYHRWRFRTASDPGDFESLVKKLSPRTLDGAVGVRDLEIGRSGSTALPDQAGVTVGFAGALVSPNFQTPDWEDSHREAFQPAMHQLLGESLAADGSAGAGYDWSQDDPVVAPPAYGALAAGLDTVPEATTPPSDDAPAWLAEVNLDPAHRAVAGLGAEVVRRHQETLAADAWDQAAGLGEINRVLNRSRLAAEVGRRTKGRLDAWDDGALLQLSRGAQARLKGADMTTTLRGRLRQSRLPDGLISGAFRRRVRPGTTVARAASASAVAGSVAPASELTQRFVSDPPAMLAYARSTVPFGTVFMDGSNADTPGAGGTDALIGTIQTFGLAALRGRIPPGASTTLPAERLTLPRAGLSLEGRASPAAATVAATTVAANTVAANTVAATRVAAPTGALGERVVADVPVAVDEGGVKALDVAQAVEVVRQKLDPVAVLALRVRSLITAPAAAWNGDDVPAGMWVDPVFTRALQPLLVEVDPELMLPGLGALLTDTVALARVNPAFVEAFLLGANVELGRELVWREFPADLTGTWLRTFWQAAQPADDVPRVADWGPGSLGTHQGSMDPDRVLVLLIKSDLLRRYPNTLIYSVKARWEHDAGTDAWERVEDPKPAPLYPIFAGSLSRDVVFLGFQLDPGEDVATHVRGSSEQRAGQPGRFFIFEQPPTAPRFGLDVGSPEHAGRSPRWWKDVSWFHALGQAESGASHVPLAPLMGTRASYDQDGENTWQETWARDAAAMARITLQRPVRMLVHADQMLVPEGEEN